MTVSSQMHSVRNINTAFIIAETDIYYQLLQYGQSAQRKTLESGQECRNFVMIIITFVGTFLSVLKAAQKTLMAWVKLQKPAFSANEGG